MEQHFLTQPAKLRALIAAAGIHPETRVLELGAGGGTVASALPPCRLTLVELDGALAAGLRQNFPKATVLHEDALSALERLEFDVLLSNLPHALTAAVLRRLQGKSFVRALVAVHEGDAPRTLEALSGCTASPLLILDEDDFSPPQSFKSQVFVLSHCAHA